MANNNLTGNEDILVKVDQNNLIYIDPNSVVDSEGDVQPRAILQENLVTYVNLEADIIPRTILAAKNDKITLTSIAKGTLTFLGNNGSDYDTSWTDSYLNTNESSVDSDTTNNSTTTNKSSQSLGIQSISIRIKGANFVPQVDINFIDVRGKTLFEAPDNSPYNAFFHLPWPIFYLTVKGYYGQAIRYRLHLVKFTSRFNENNGNFEISTSFVGSTYAFMNDIPLKGVLNAPYMYAYDNEPIDQQTYNAQTQQYNVKVKQSSRGYQLLKSVYAEYKEKGLLEADFPVKTLKEVAVIAKNLDRILEKSLFGNTTGNGIDPRILQTLKEMGQLIENFQQSIQGWRNSNVVTSGYTDSSTKVLYSYLTGTIDDKKSVKKLYYPDDATKPDTVLQYKIDTFNSEIKRLNGVFIEIGKTETHFKPININTISDLSVYVIPNKRDLTSSLPGELVGIAITKLLDDINELYNTFNKSKKVVQDYIEKKINELIKDPSIGFGFRPTIRNIFAIIMANADVYVRLMKETHQKAFEAGSQRQELINPYCIEGKKGENIYPWPEIRKKASDGKQQVVAYPGDPDLQSKLNASDKTLWPEIDFLENYYKITTLMVDPNGVKEATSSNVNFILPTDDYLQNVNSIGAASTLYFNVPYLNQTQASFLYEIWERSYYFSLFDSFDIPTILELANLEFKNIQNTINNKNDDNLELIAILKERVTSLPTLQTLLEMLSPFERFPYYSDQLPTIPFLKNVINQSYKIEQFVVSTTKTNKDTNYNNLNNWLRNYEVEDYRNLMYPFNSPLYQTYLTTPYKTDIKGALSVDTNNGFICSQSSIYQKLPQLFSERILNGTTYVNILNTPYFHKQLYNDFNGTTNYGRYAGSAYLLLNSLAFYDLSDIVVNDKSSFFLSAMFKEVGATHFVPYHLILKWGSIYHRYKKYLTTNVDILSGFLDTFNVTTPINQSLFYDNGTNDVFAVADNYNINNIDYISYTGASDMGIHPFYDAIFSQIVNGYAHYDVSVGAQSFNTNVSDGGIVEFNKNSPNNNIRYWTQFIDNSKYGDGTDLRYTILPSCALNAYNPNDNFSNNENYFRIMWSDFSNKEYVNNTFSGVTYSAPNEYTSLTLNSNYKKIIDLIGTFSPDILDEFEQMFLDFATDVGTINNDETQNPKYFNAKYVHFQNLLRDIVSFSGVTSDDNKITQINSIKKAQKDALTRIQSAMLDSNNFVKLTITNPKELDAHVLNGFAKTAVNNTLKWNPFNANQLTTKNLSFIKLYIGEDIDEYYVNFFAGNDIELSEANILLFRPLILLYGGFLDNNISGSFPDYVKNNILQSKNKKIDGFNERFVNFLSVLIGNFATLNASVSVNDKPIDIVGGYNNAPLKLDLYQSFKSFNDKWVAGNSIGQRLLIEEFLFLDKANKDIGDEFYIDIAKLIPIIDDRNKNINLYEAISTLIQNSGLDMRPLPAYVNFYGTNHNGKSKTTTSRKTASDLFGTFLDVNYQDASPKIVIQFVGENSKHLANGSEDDKFNDDSFNCSMVNNNPLLITTSQAFSLGDLTKSNKVVSFEVSFGDQNQGMFKGLTLDQSTLRNTSASAYVLEHLARSESGANAANVDISLFDYYKTAAYSCEVKMLGNVMIQPTMFFYLKNVPMFKGSYWITEVTHDVRNNSVMTTFKGARMPIGSLPNPKDSFSASYKTLFDKLTNQAESYLKLSSNADTTQVILDSKLGPVSTEWGKTQSWEKIENFVNTNAGKTAFGVPFNGGGVGDNGKYIQHYQFTNTTSIIPAAGPITNWLRANVVMMEDKDYGGKTMDIISSFSQDSFTITWEDLKAVNNLYYFALRYEFFDNSTILSPDIYYPSPSRGGIHTTFYNPNPNVKANPYYLVTQFKSKIVDNKKKLDWVAGPVSKYVPDGYGIAMSKSLMNFLKLKNGDYVYFDVDNNQIISGTQNLTTK